MYGVQAAAGLGKLGFGLQQAGLARDREAALRQAGLPQMSTAQEYFDLYQNASRSKQFEQEKAMTQSVLASNLATLQGAGSRAVIGGAGAAQLTAQRGMAAAAEADFKRQQAALGSLAAAQQQTELYNFNARSRQYATDLASAQEGFTSGIETAVSGADQAIGSTAMMLRELGGNKKDDDPTQDPTQDPRSPGYVRETPGLTVPESFGGTKEIGSTFAEVQGVTPPQTDYSGGFDITKSNFGGVDFNDPVTNATRNQAAFDNLLYYPNTSIPIDAFVPSNNAQGGSVTTPGKYTADHSVEYDVKTKGGKTIATVTGDETLVFNPKQRRFLKKVIGRLLKGQNVQLGKNETKTAKQTLKAFEK
jgi:hypothetical protein